MAWCVLDLVVWWADADQKAYAAMELQTMALDSRSQVRGVLVLGWVGMLMPGSTWRGLDRPGEVWRGLVRSGEVWLDLGFEVNTLVAFDV